MSYQMAWSFVVMASVVLFVVALRADERELRRKFSEYGEKYPINDKENK